MYFIIVLILFFTKRTGHSMAYLYIQNDILQWIIEWILLEEKGRIQRCIVDTITHLVRVHFVMK
jgi:hypothetical protein